MTPEERKKLVAQAQVGLRAVIDEVTGYRRGPGDSLAGYYEEQGGEAGDYRVLDGDPEDPR